MFRVPLLLEKSAAIIYRLNMSATKQLKPYAGATSGYDSDFRETITYDREPNPNDPPNVETVRENARIELPAIRVPCQVERITFEALDQSTQGDDPTTQLRFVFWRGDLEQLGLIDRKTRELFLHKNDRIETVEAWSKPGVQTVSMEPPGVYITEIQPASWGFGPDGYDLHIAFVSRREQVM